jgi:hypothetical protein
MYYMMVGCSVVAASFGPKQGVQFADFCCCIK